jgi:hypothetical protein
VTSVPQVLRVTLRLKRTFIGGRSELRSLRLDASLPMSLDRFREVAVSGTLIRPTGRRHREPSGPSRPNPVSIPRMVPSRRRVRPIDLIVS